MTNQPIPDDLRDLLRVELLHAASELLGMRGDDAASFLRARADSLGRRDPSPAGQFWAATNVKGTTHDDLCSSVTTLLPTVPPRRAQCDCGADTASSTFTPSGPSADAQVISDAITSAAATIAEAITLGVAK